MLEKENEASQLFLKLSFMLNFAFFSLMHSNSNADENCLNCHQSISAKRFVHHPIRAGEKSCKICHIPTSSLKEGHPAFKEVDPRKSCTVCHDQFAGFESKTSIHHPLQKEGCLHCHDPHAAKNKGLIRFEVSSSNSCLHCHREKNHEFEKMPFQHKAMKDKRLCLNCHDPHFSKHERLLQKGQTQLCSSCHKEFKQNRPFVHDPVQKGKCTECHDVHGGQHSKLLRQKYLIESYRPYQKESFGLCLKCHKSSLVEKQQVKDETLFRNGSLNLHYIHVMKNKKKSRSCNTCHEVHSSQQEKLIAKHFTFQGKRVPIRFQRTQNGGNCTTACHGNKVYNRLDKVLNQGGL